MIDQLTERLKREAIAGLAKSKQRAIIDGIKTHKTHRMDVEVYHCPSMDEFIFSKESNKLEFRTSLRVEKIKPKGWVCPLP